MISKKNKSRLLSVLLAIAMVVTLIPVTAFAAEPLTLESAVVTTDGGVGLTFNKELSTTDIVNKVKAGFTITGLEETPKTITNVTVSSTSGSAINFVKLSLSPTIKGGEVAGLSYTPGDIQAADGGILAEIPSMDIVNFEPHPELDTTALPTATVGSAYTHTFTVYGEASPYTFSVDGGSLPMGLTMSSTGVISGTPTVAASFTFYIMVQDANQAIDIKGFNIKVNPPTDKVCEIDGTQYETIDAALSAVPANGAATIKLLHNINYNKGIILDNKKITFALNGNTLNVVSSVEGVHALAVYNGGGITLSGTGALNVIGPARGYGVTVASNSTLSEVTVTNATAIGTESKAAHAYGKASLTVLGDVTATGINSFGTHAQTGALIEVRGNISAGNMGICVSDATVKAAGNVQASGNDIIGNPEGIGVAVYDGVAEIGGNVTGNRVGAMIRAGGSITIEGVLTAPDYIQFADDAPTAFDDYLATTTKPGYRTYQHSSAGTVWVKGGALPVSQYTIMVQNDGNGTGSANFNIASEGAEITLTATPNSGYKFKEWQVISGGVTIANNMFYMLDSNVTVKAIFDLIPAATFPVTGVKLNTTNITLYSNRTPNTATLIATVSPANATDKTVTWQSSNTAVATVDANGMIRAVGNGTVAITVITNDGSKTATCTVAISVYSSGSSSSNGGSYAQSVPTAPTTSEKKPDQPVTGLAWVSATAGEKGTANVNILDKDITDAITKAQADAIVQGKTANGISVEVNVTMPRGTTSLIVTLTQSSLNSLVTAGITSLEISGSPVTLTFDKKVLAEIQKQSTGDVTITIKPVHNISAAAKKLIGSRPVYDISVSYVKDGKTIAISAFNGGIATISIPYTRGKNEAAGYLYGVYMNAKGNATRITGSAYDANAGAVLMPTGHLSVYGVGYTAPSVKFTDIRNHWGKESIDYVVGRGLLSGTSKTTFAPNATMTRGMLVTALARLAGVDTKLYTTNSFTDVNTDSAFRPYIEWAYKKGIVQGMGNNQFAPDRATTREEISVIFANYAKATGYKLPITREATTYADASSIGSVYKTAVTAIQQAGIMMGGNGNKFNPKDSVTRAEVSAMLHRYVKLTIDPATAQGWALNDAGQYLYYKDGKALTGTQTIDGTKYFFNADGSLAKSTKVNRKTSDKSKALSTEL